MALITSEFVFSHGDDDTDVTVRVVGTPADPKFVVKDLCEALGIRSHRTKVASITPEFRSRHVVDGRSMTVVNEGGLYELIMTSQTRNERVLRFRTWVCGTVLPEVRKSLTSEIPTLTNIDKQLQLANCNRDTLYMSTACQHFSSDAALMCLVNERLKNEFSPEPDAKRRRIGDRLTTITVALEQAGYSPSVVAKHRQKIGIRVSKAYRRLFGTVPKKTTQFVLGRCCSVNCYSSDELEQLMPIAQEVLESSD